MKFLLSVILVTCLAACGTVGGAISGAGADLQRVGDMIKGK